MIRAGELRGHFVGGGDRHPPAQSSIGPDSDRNWEWDWTVEPAHVAAEWSGYAERLPVAEASGILESWDSLWAPANLVFPAFFWLFGDTRRWDFMYRSGRTRRRWIGWDSPLTLPPAIPEPWAMTLRTSELATAIALGQALRPGDRSATFAELLALERPLYEYSARLTALSLAWAIIPRTGGLIEPDAAVDGHRAEAHGTAASDNTEDGTEESTGFTPQTYSAADLAPRAITLFHERQDPGRYRLRRFRIETHIRKTDVATLGVIAMSALLQHTPYTLALVQPGQVWHPAPSDPWREVRTLAERYPGWNYASGLAQDQRAH
ncbi:hypothetical protein [Mycetocola saprophilus]|uniref:hypothetical protein n=1 Tax=Mycetocola saprophilus TaxID=76636 RepID=UPI003BF2DD4B